MIQSLTDNQARTEAISSGIEKKRFSAHRIEVHGTLTAHLVRSLKLISEIDESLGLR
jgi:hypothetical protein